MTTFNSHGQGNWPETNRSQVKLVIEFIHSHYIDMSFRWTWVKIQLRPGPHETAVLVGGGVAGLGQSVGE